MNPEPPIDFDLSEDPPEEPQQTAARGNTESADAGHAGESADAGGSRTRSDAGRPDEGSLPVRRLPPLDATELPRIDHGRAPARTRPVSEVRPHARGKTRITRGILAAVGAVLLALAIVLALRAVDRAIRGTVSAPTPSDRSGRCA